MTYDKKNYLKIFSIIFSVIILFLLISIFINQLEKRKNQAAEPITINLLTNVHPNLPWKFKAIEKKILIKPGEIKTIEYIVENLKNVDSTGIATMEGKWTKAAVQPLIDMIEKVFALLWMFGN